MNDKDKKLVEGVVNELKRGIVAVLDEKVVGVYLFGSLTYGGFDEGRSDIDLMVVVKDKLSDKEVADLESVHKEAEKRFPHWHERIEASYTPASMLGDSGQPRDPRPYYGEGKMWREAGYGNEWLINLYLIREYGKCLCGMQVEDVFKKVDIEEVQKACVEDLRTEWVPKRSDDSWMGNDHNRSYLILNLCRILYTVMTGNAKSKREATNWVRNEYPEWRELIDRADEWKYGDKMEKVDKVVEFLGFVENEVLSKGLKII